MTFENFFIYSALIEERQLDIGFELYGTGHLVWLAAIFASALIAASMYKKAGEERKIKIKKFFAAALLVSEILKDTELAVQGANMLDYMPLHLCSFTILVMMLHSYGRWQNVTSQLFAYAMFPGAVAALLFCNWTEYPFFNYMNIHSFLFHGWIVVYFAMIYHDGEVRASYRGLWKTTAAMIALSVPVYIFNCIFGTNYLFLNEASPGSPLIIVWDIFGERFGDPGYLAGIVLMVLIIFHALYVVYKLSAMFKEKRRGRGNGNKLEKKEKSEGSKHNKGKESAAS